MSFSCFYQSRTASKFILVLLVFICFPPSLSAETQLFSKELNDKIIESVTIDVVPIFEDPSLGAPYSTMNSLKISTQQDTVRQELNFKVGDRFNAFSMSESLRRLRAIRYLSNVSIIPVQNANGGLDITVVVQDTWTLIPQFNISSGSGNNSQSAGFSESNFLGLGKRAEVSYTKDDARKTIETVYEDNRFLGTDTRLLAGYFNLTDGHQEVLYYGLPFRTLLDPVSWYGTVNNNDSVGRLFKDGTENYIFRQKLENYSARYRIARNDEDSDVRRFTLGYDFQKADFSKATIQDYKDLDLDPATVSNDPALLPKNRLFSGPNFSYQYIEPKYISMNYIDRFERIEDYNLGTVQDVGFTIAPEAFGSDYNALLVSLNHGQGYSFSPASFIRGELGLSGRVEPGTVVNDLSRAEIKFYNVLGDAYWGDLWCGRHTLALNFNTEYGDDLDRDRQLSAGADNGLRGFSARSFNGDKRALLNIEDRVHLAENVFDILSFGTAAFIDVGGATYDSYGTLFTDNLNADIGAGLRFAFPRSSGGRVLRFDIATPVNDGPDGSRALEFRLIFAGGQIFSSKLRSESEGPEAANVSVGFER